MRKTIIRLLFVSGVIFLAYACTKKKDVSSFDNVSTGSYVTLVKNGNLILDYGNLATTKADITVKEFGAPIEKVKIYATEGAVNLDKTKWKAIKEVALSGETKLEVSATELATGLGIAPTALKTGTSYSFYNELILKDGRVFSPANTNGAFQGITNYNMAMTWQAIVVCPFNPTGFIGNFEILEDGWADWSPGDVVQVSAATANSITLIVYPNPAFGGFNQQPVTVVINPATGAATVASQSYGGYTGFDNDIKVKTVGSNNWVFSCTGTISLKLNHTGAANWGDYNLRLRKL